MRSSGGKIKVLLITTQSEHGGAQTHLRDLINGISEHCDFGLAVGKEGWLTDHLRNLNIPVFILPNLVRNPNSASDFRALIELKTAIRHFDPDVLHAHTFKAGLISRLVARLTKIPVVYTPHAWAFAEGVPWFWRAVSIPLEWGMARFGGSVILVSENEKLSAEHYGILRPGSAQVIYNGVPDASEQADPGADLEPTVVMVGRFAAQKAQELLVRASAQIQLTHRLVFVGDGETLEAVRTLARESRTSDRIEFWGTRDDVAMILANAQVFVLATNWESFPISILEAMRAGLPIVATDVGGVREAVVDGETGFLVPHGDESVLRDRLERLLRDPLLRVRMGAAGRVRFERLFTVEKMLERTLGVYQTVQSRKI
jgi:glycosyltransferase involved in cell wall biosynthesis